MKKEHSCTALSKLLYSPRASVCSPVKWRCSATWVPLGILLGFPGSSVVKNPPAMQEMQVQSLGREDPMREDMAIHSSILARKIPWTEEPGRLRPIGPQRVRRDDRACMQRSLSGHNIYKLMKLKVEPGSSRFLVICIGHFKELFSLWNCSLCLREKFNIQERKSVSFFAPPSLGPVTG